MKQHLRQLAPRGIRAYRILGGPLRGRKIVTSLYDYPSAILGWTEGPLLAWFQLHVKPRETWLDVGAHYGYTALALAGLVGEGGRVYAFEPSITTAGHLNRTRTLNGMDHLRVVPFGLGRQGGMRVDEVPMSRGMANHSLGGRGTESIYTVGLDYLWAAVGTGPIHGVKIDVQGQEGQVLGGMVGILKSQRPKLVIEFHPGVDRDEICGILRKAGYGLPGYPIEQSAIATTLLYADDLSYAFEPESSDR